MFSLFIRLYYFAFALVIKHFKLELRLAKNFSQIWQHSNTSCIPPALSHSLSLHRFSLAMINGTYKLASNLQQVR